MSNSRPLALCRVISADHVAARVLGIVHDQADVLEKAGEAVELGERLDQLLEVLEPAGRVGRAVLLPHAHVARFLEHGLGQLRAAARAAASSRQRSKSSSRRRIVVRTLRAQLVGAAQGPRGDATG